MQPSVLAARRPQSWGLRLVLLLLVVVHLIGQPQRAEAFVPALAAEVVVGVGSQALISHLERCRALPAASKGALTAGATVMRRTPTGWGKAFVAAGAIAAAWAAAKAWWWDRNKEPVDPSDSAGVPGSVNFEFSSNLWRVWYSMDPSESDPEVEYRISTSPTSGNWHPYSTSGYGRGGWSASLQRRTYKSGQGWVQDTVWTITLPPSVQPQDDAEPFYDGMTAHPDFAQQFNDALDRQLQAEGATGAGESPAPNAPYLWQKSGTSGSSAGDWTMTDFSPEVDGDTGFGSSPALEPSPEPTTQPSTEPSPEPSASASPSPETPRGSLPSFDAEFFVTRFTTGIQGKFPFDLIVGTFSYQDPDLTFEVWGYEHDINWIKPIIATMAWVSIIGLIIAAIIAL